MLKPLSLRAALALSGGSSLLSRQMVMTKLLGLWLFVVGLLWIFGFVWLYLVMTAFTTPLLPLPLHFLVGFSGPSVLIVGSILLMAMLYPRVGAVLVLIACAWLTWSLGRDSVTGFWEDSPPYLLLIVLLFVIATADVAAVLVFYRVRKTI